MLEYLLEILQRHIRTATVTLTYFDSNEFEFNKFYFFHKYCGLKSTIYVDVVYLPVLTTYHWIYVAVIISRNIVAFLR